MDDAEQITLADGRRLGFSEYGAPDGEPVFYHHGWPSSRLEAANFAEAATRAGVRLIAVDRPGMGRSDLKPARRLLDWPDDLVALADQLGIGGFRILGVSGGGPYVAACAYAVPDRILGATIVAGLSPMTDPATRDGMRRMNRILFFLGKRAPWLLGGALSAMRSSLSNPSTLDRMVRDLPDVDRVMISGEAAEGIMAMGRESFVQGIEGNVIEGGIYPAHWGFELSEITIPVSVWQGSLDVNVPQSNGRILAKRIPGATPHFVEGEGHFSLQVNHADAILEDLLG